MRLTGEQQAMRSGEFGRMRQWAIEHQIKVGQYFGADDFVPVIQAHIMTDTEPLGAAGSNALSTGLTCRHTND